MLLVRFLAVLALPSAELFNHFFAAVRAAEIKDFLVVEDHLYVATYLVEAGLILGVCEGVSFEFESRLRCLERGKLINQLSA